MYRIQSVRVARSALVLATLTASFYVVAFFVAFVSSAVFGYPPPGSRPDSAAMLVILPILFVVVWLFFYPIAALFCFIYNQVAKMTGGVEFSVF